MKIKTLRAGGEKVGIVVFDDAGNVVGREDQRTRREPEALTAAVAVEELPTRWRGIIAIEDEITGDDRMFLSDSLEWDDDGVALALDWSKERGMGHDNAVTIGTIDRVWREGTEVWGEGRLDLESPEGIDAARRVHENLALAPSVDLDDIDLEIRVLSSLLEEFDAMMGIEVYDEDEEPAEEEEEEEREVHTDGDGEERETVMRMEAGEELMVITRARLRGATLVSIPAFKGTTIEGIYEDADAEEEVVAEAVAIAAAAAPKRPPLEWFQNPNLEAPTPLRIEGDRVYGHIAAWGTCHTGFKDCVEPPSSPTKYAYFHTGEVLSDKGGVAVGRLTVDTDHADRRLSATDTIAHYEHSGTCVAYVRAGEDAHGIWVAGYINPRASEGQIEELRAHPPSGDWRRIGGALEMVATLAVNSAGFPIPRAMVAGGHVMTLQRTSEIPTEGQMVVDPEISAHIRRISRREAAGYARSVAQVRKAALDRFAARVMGR